LKKLLLPLFILLLCSTYTKAQDTLAVRKQLEQLSETVKGLNGTVDFTLVGAPISELLRAVAETHDLNVSLNKLPQISITNNFNNVLVKDLFVFLCEEYGLQIRFTNNIFSFEKKYQEMQEPEIVLYDPINDLLTIDAPNYFLGKLAQKITEQTGKNVLVNQSIVTQVVSGYIKELPFEDALESFAEANNLIYTKKSDLIFQLSKPEITNQNNNVANQTNVSPIRRPSGRYLLETFRFKGDPYVSLNCVQEASGSIIYHALDQLNIDYLVLKEPNGMMNCHLDSVLFDAFLDIALETSGLTYNITDEGVYLIGQSDGITGRQARVYSFKNRSVEGVMDIIPKALMKGIQVEVFNDLNALIITGSEKSNSEVERFLEQIDKPVPNVLIEVMVVDIKKSKTINTGIKAFLSDSVPSTSGQVLGGVNLTLSSQTFNKILNNLDSRGILNLGKVTPNFYATIQAMENNNNINIRSTPKLSTLNGHEASLTIGKSVYYLIQTQNVTGGVNPIVTVTPRYEKVEANLDLKINPFVSYLQDITLNIQAEFSDFIPPTVTGAPPGNSTRKFISKIRVKNEEMIVIGGLEEASNSQSGSGVPVLSRIPVLKWLFSSRSNSKADNKLLIFIKPTIVY